ncbi:MAG: transglutaminase-like cysteine peptidase [Magnetococcales bacterium]|nr:transglutaminase-like cysteine peptidase [Magnetococcales bacterium]
MTRKHPGSFDHHANEYCHSMIPYALIFFFTLLPVFPGAIAAESSPGEAIFATSGNGTDPSGRTARLKAAAERHQQRHPEHWDETVKQLRALEGVEKLERAHQFINKQVTYRDLPQWKSPLETFTQGGNCKDYAIAKFLLLEEGGLPASEMRLVSLAPTGSRPAHVILVARINQKHYVLDSAGRSQSQHVVPLDAFNERNRTIVWSGSTSGYSLATIRGSGGGEMIITTLGPRPALTTGERLLDIAAELRLVRPGEAPLTTKERQKLALLRAYFHDPSEENASHIKPEEARKLNAMRQRLRKIYAAAGL